MDNAFLSFLDDKPGAVRRADLRENNLPGWCVFFCFVILSSVHASGGETLPREGLFPQSAHWANGGIAGATRIHVLPDRMEFSQTDRGPVYDMYGRGQGISDVGENGFYTFTGKDGSWSLTAHVKWIDSGEGKSNAFAGLMIRGRENTRLSKMYAIGLSTRPDLSKAPSQEGMFGGTAWRISLDMHLFLGTIYNRSLTTDSGFFFRLTYNATQNLVYSDVSSNGMAWELIHQTRIELEEPVQYGLFIANGNDTTTPVHAQFSQVTLEPAVLAERILPRDSYTPGEDLEVRLHVLNPSEQKREAVITEIHESSWEVHSISPGGILAEDKITWSLFLEPGLNTLTYAARPPLTYEGTAHFRGRAGNIPVGGRAHLNGGLGVFEDVADWGSSENPPQVSQTKLPGVLSIDPSGGDPIYYLKGNGIGEKICWDEGFFAYVQRTGSCTLSAKLEIPEEKPGGRRDNSRFGLMIREKAGESNSIHYTIQMVSRPGIASSTPEYKGEIHWRNRKDGISYQSGIYDVEGREVIFNQAPVYFRISRIVPGDWLLSEWSKDGSQWQAADFRPLKMEETAAYGVCISNREYSEIPAFGQASQVTIQSASPIAIRSFSPAFFRPERPIRVRLDVINPGPEIQDMAIEENLPPGWTAVRISREGQIQGHRITWALPAPPGSTAMEYEAEIHDSNSPVAFFHGVGEGHPIFGDTRVYPVLREARGEAIQQWRYWKAGEDFSFQDLNRISLNPGGIVFVEDPPGGKWFRLDGYALSSLPMPEGREMVRESASGRIWSVSFTETAANPSRILTGFQEYRDDRWIFHGLEGPYLSGWRSFLINGNEEILVLLQEKLVSWNPATRTFQMIRRADETSLSAFGEMTPAGDGSIWIGGPEGVVYIQAAEGGVHSDSLWMDYPLDPRLNTRDVQKMTAGPQRGIYATVVSRPGGQYYVVRFVGEKWETLHMSPSPVQGFRGWDSVLWILDFNEHLVSKYKPGPPGQPGQRIQEGIFHGQVREAVYASPEEFWVLSSEGLAKNIPKLWSAPPEISGWGKPIYGIQEDPAGRLWFLGADSLIGFDNREWSIYPIPAPYAAYSSPPRVYQQLVALATGELVLGGFTQTHPVQDRKYSQLLVFDPEREQFTLARREGIAVCGIGPARNGNAWIASWRCVGSPDDRLERFDGHRFQSVLKLDNRINSQSPVCIFEDGRRHLWLGLDEGIRCYPRRQREDNPEAASQLEGSFTLVNPAGGFPGKIPGCMNLLPDGNLGVGTQNDLWVWDGNTGAPARSNLGPVYALLSVRDGSVWVGAKTGLHRYQHHVWQPYGPGEGIPPAAVYSLYEDTRGRIWAGTESGVFLYHPEADRDPPQTFIAEETLLYQQEIRTGRNLRVDYSGRDRWMQTPDEQLLFSCRVDGTGWSPYASSTIFSSTDFTAGAHRFEVKALDKNRNADPTPAVFRFYVYPIPWQEQRWFLPVVISVLLVIAALAMTTYFARLRVVHYATNLESMVKARTEELRKTEMNVLEISEREQQRIGQELHDGVVQDLTGAIFLGEIVHDDLQPGSPGLSQQMEKMISILESTREQTRKLAKGLSPVNVQKTALMSSLLELCEHVRQIYNIPCELLCPQSISIEDPQISLNLYRIAQEAVNNALKHAQAGKITVFLRNENGHVILSVEDDGIGMTDADGKSGRMGLAIMRYRANRIHAQWSIQSEPSRGTKVTCTLPLGSM